MHKKFLQGLLFAGMGLVLCLQEVGAKTELDCERIAELLEEECYTTWEDVNERALQGCREQVDDRYDECIEDVSRH